MARTGCRAVMVAVVVAAATPALAQPFTDVAADVGVLLDEPKDGGHVFADFNGDGRLDLLVNGTLRSWLFYQAAGGFEDVTATHAAALATTVTERSSVATDLDNDGFVDFVVNASGAIHVYRNGGPSASPPHSFGDPAWSFTTTDDPMLNCEGIGFLDRERDGLLDLVVDQDGSTWLFRNGGAFDFTRALPADTGLADNSGFAIAADRDGDYIALADVDVDGFVDVHVRSRMIPELYVNGGDGRFTASTAIPQLDATSNNKGGSVFCDFDGDGRFDLFYSDGQGTGVNQVYLQRSPLEFTPLSISATFNDVDGVACGDVDLDGDVDLYLSQTGPDLLLLAERDASGGVSFTPSGDALGPGDGESVSLVDYDDDGDLDVFVSQTGPLVDDGTGTFVRSAGPNALYRNDVAGGRRFLVVRVVANVGTCESPILRDDVGAVVELRDDVSGWRSGVQEINGGMGHGGQAPPRIHFGIATGSGPTYRLRIRFQHLGTPPVELAVTPAEVAGRQLVVDALDPDGDGIPTAIEVEHTVALGEDDGDGDGLPAWADPDSDGDLLSDAAEAVMGCAPVDADRNGTPDYLQGTAVPVVDGGGVVVRDAGATPDGGAGSFVAHGSGLARCSAVAGRPARRGPPLAVALAMTAAAGMLVRAASRRRAR